MEAFAAFVLPDRRRRRARPVPELRRIPRPDPSVLHPAPAQGSSRRRRDLPGAHWPVQISMVRGPPDPNHRERGRVRGGGGLVEEARRRGGPSASRLWPGDSRPGLQDRRPAPRGDRHRRRPDRRRVELKAMCTAAEQRAATAEACAASARQHASDAGQLLGPARQETPPRREGNRKWLFADGRA